ncbi:MAG: hypothetical protein LUO85_05545 [Methanomassiliicoccales archaeon]|nr:hypothetical protein [Methanomassiliicoccales archaeon]
MATPRLGRKGYFLFGFLMGTILGVVTLVVIEQSIPRLVPSETASNFFFAASGVNATLLVAIAVTISAIMGKTPANERRWRTLFFIGQLTIVFLGTIASGLGILSFNPEVPFDGSKFKLLVDLVFTTWVIGFMLLIAGIWISILPDGGAKDAK